MKLDELFSHAVDSNGIHMDVLIDDAAGEQYARRSGRGQQSIVFREEDHPRHPAGIPEGGQFAATAAAGGAITSPAAAAAATSKITTPQPAQTGPRRAPPGGVKSDITGRFYKGGKIIPTTGRDAARAVDSRQLTLVEMLNRAIEGWGPPDGTGEGDQPFLPTPPAKQHQKSLYAMSVAPTAPTAAHAPKLRSHLSKLADVRQAAAQQPATPNPKAPSATAALTGPSDPNWQEEKHPRGQPKNKGQFASAPGGEGVGDNQGTGGAAAPTPQQPQQPAPAAQTTNPAATAPAGPSPDNPLLRQPRLEKFHVVDQSVPKGPIGKKLAGKFFNKPPMRYLVGEESGTVVASGHRKDGDQAEADQKRFAGAKSFANGAASTQTVTFGDDVSSLTLKLNAAFGLHLKAPKHTPQAEPEHREFDQNDPEIGSLDLVKKQGKWVVRPPDARMKKAWAKQAGDQQPTATTSPQGSLGMSGEAARGDATALGINPANPNATRYKPPKEIDNKRVRTAAEKVAKDWDVSVDELLPFIDAEYEGAKQLAAVREDAKKWLRRTLGSNGRDMSAADARVIENGGHDFSSAHKMKTTDGRPRFPGMANFDTAVHSLASHFPDLGLMDRGGGEQAPKAGADREAWDMLREGAGRIPQPWDDDVLLAAARRHSEHAESKKNATTKPEAPAAEQAQDHGDEHENQDHHAPVYNEETGEWEGEADDSVPFSRRGERERYSLEDAQDWLEREQQVEDYARRRHTPGRGQKQLAGMEGHANEHWVTIRGSHVLISGKGEVISGPKHMLGSHIDPKHLKKPHEGGTKPPGKKQATMFGGAAEAERQSVLPTPQAGKAQAEDDYPGLPHITAGEWKPLLGVGPDASLEERMKAAFEEHDRRSERMLIERDFLAGEFVSDERLAKLDKRDPLREAVRRGQKEDARREQPGGKLMEDHAAMVKAEGEKPKPQPAAAPAVPQTDIATEIARRSIAEKKLGATIAKSMGIPSTEYAKIRRRVSDERDRLIDEANPKPKPQPPSAARAAAMAKQQARQAEEDRRANQPTAEQLRAAVADVRQTPDGQWWNGDNSIPKATKREAVQAAVNAHRAAAAYAASFYGEGKAGDWKLWSGDFRDILPENELKKMFPKKEHAAVISDPANREKLVDAIDRVNKKRGNEPEGGWTDADKVPEHLQSPGGAAAALSKPTSSPSFAKTFEQREAAMNDEARALERQKAAEEKRMGGRRSGFVPPAITSELQGKSASKLDKIDARLSELKVERQKLAAEWRKAVEEEEAREAAAPTAPATTPAGEIARFPGENGTESIVTRRPDGQFSVALRDRDSGETVQQFRIFPTEAAAVAHAKTVSLPATQAGAEKPTSATKAGQPVTADEHPGNGNIITDSSGKEYLVMKARHGIVEGAPIENGKAIVNSTSIQRFYVGTNDTTREQDEIFHTGRNYYDEEKAKSAAAATGAIPESEPAAPSAATVPTVPPVPGAPSATIPRPPIGQSKTDAAKDAATAAKFRDRPRVELLRAPAGGKVSDVDGVFYKGGQLMPVHGLSVKSETDPNTPKFEGGGAGKPNENAADPGKRKPRNTEMSPDDIEAERARRKREEDWSTVSTGPLGKALGLGDRPHGINRGWGIAKKWMEVAEEHGEDKVKKVMEAAKARAIETFKEDIAKNPWQLKDNGAWMEPRADLTPEEAMQRYEEHQEALLKDVSTPQRNGYTKKHLAKNPSTNAASFWVAEMLGQKGIDQPAELRKLHDILEGKAEGPAVVPQVVATTAPATSSGDKGERHRLYSRGEDWTERDVPTHQPPLVARLNRLISVHAPTPAQV